MGKYYNSCEETLVLGWSIWLLLKPLAIGTAVGLAINEINSLAIMINKLYLLKRQTRDI